MAEPSSRSAYRAILTLAVAVIGLLAVAFVFLVPLGTDYTIRATARATLYKATVGANPAD